MNVYDIFQNSELSILFPLVTLVVVSAFNF